MLSLFKVVFGSTASMSMSCVANSSPTEMEAEDEVADGDGRTVCLRAYIHYNRKRVNSACSLLPMTSRSQQATEYLSKYKLVGFDS